MAYMRNGIEEGVDVVKEEDNHIILETKNKNRIGGIYTNGRWCEKKWKEWLGKLEEKIGNESSILGDSNTHSYTWDEIRVEDASGKVMDKWNMGTSWTVMEEDSRPTWERTREGRRETSRIDFVISKCNSEWLLTKSTKLISDYWPIHGELKIDLARKVEERIAVD